MGIDQSRRGFLSHVGRGTLIATLGSSLASDMGLAGANAGESEVRLTFGDIEPLVALMQETPIDRLIETLHDRRRQGTDLKTLFTAAALANARTFGGEDYIGFHTMMALAPAYRMAQELSGRHDDLLAFKVMYRNTARINEYGGPKAEKLHRVTPTEVKRPDGDGLRDRVRARDMSGADAYFAAFGTGATHAEDAFNAALFAVGDNTEVHRTVLPYRSWDLLEIIGKDHAQTLLRQSVHYCVKSEREFRHTEAMDRPRQILPKLMTRFGLECSVAGSRSVDDAWVASLADTFFASDAESAAEAAAAALAEGVDPGAVGEAISLAANQLVLRDAGRFEREISPGKPKGSVHGDSIGVHACDSANAWRNMALVANTRNQVACLILGAYQVAEDRTARGGDFQNWKPRPHPEELAQIDLSSPNEILKELDIAIRANDQARACALTGRASHLGHDPRPLFALFLRYAVSEDGALHAEKFYRTTSEEFASARPAFRWRYLVALARVTASTYGRKASGYEEACRRLGITV